MKDGSRMLTFVLDPGDSSDDVCGTLRIGGDAEICVPNAYLDSWLAAVLECLCAVNKGASRYEVDLAEEPHPFIAAAHDGTLSFRFENQMAMLGPIPVAIRQITRDIQDLLSLYPLRNEALRQEIGARLRLPGA